MSYVWNVKGLTLDCKDLWKRKSEFVTNTQFLCAKFARKFEVQWNGWTIPLNKM